MVNKIKNPIIPGFYPDPTICRVGDDYYLACSSFELYPGIPVFHSKDLVHWEQIGNAMTVRNDFFVEKNSMVGGVMAPTLRYHEGLFYIINTNFCDKGNYIITAENPTGPWSAPHWLKDVPGIDASLFFDNDGKAYIMGTGNVWDNGAGEMERGIWLAEYDMEHFRMCGTPVTIFNSALRGGAAPESPRHMGFTCPIINVGHADMVELPDGSWYAVMLASRLIDGSCKNLGRETFLCPIVWEREWPLFSPQTGKLEWEYEAPKCLAPIEYQETKKYYDFEQDELETEWVSWGMPKKHFYKIEDSKLIVQCRSASLDEELRPMQMDGNRSYENYAPILAQRQCEIDTTVSCQMSFYPKEKESAGLAVIQAMNHQLHFERVYKDKKQILQAVLITADYNHPPYFPGFESVTQREVLAEAECDMADIVLQIEIRGEKFKLRYGSTKEKLRELCTADGYRLNPEKVGCMSGTIIGMFATGNGMDSINHADFDWFEI